ncbi:hypothetical protein LCGC14_0095260 [marine sediment metagenome]|uniref:Uncharacterized protein n=1 Tax=marine sediment metagenome TaxID=412755 RepID=A0A0F9YGQ2_9ZZZZ|nr:hypothetical protein [Phycisphaerae bacterium]HDZ45142.1 hypothetical protein [Phycisphaerae bacterium]
MTTLKTLLDNPNDLVCFAAGAIAALLGVWLGARILHRVRGGEPNVLLDGRSPTIQQDQTD